MSGGWTWGCGCAPTPPLCCCQEGRNGFWVLLEHSDWHHSLPGRCGLYAIPRGQHQQHRQWPLEIHQCLRQGTWITWCLIPFLPDSLISQLLGCPLEICPWLPAVAFLLSLGFPKPIMELSWQPKPFWEELSVSTGEQCRAVLFINL